MLSFLRVRNVGCLRSFMAGVCVVLAVLAVGFFVAHTADWYCRARYAHINPDARCAADSSPGFMRGYEEFGVELSAWIEEQKDAGNIRDAAVYFRDLQNGPWFGIRESEQFLPASLFKLPVMMAVLKAAEQHPELRREQLAITSLPDMQNNTDDPARTLQPGVYYTIDELLFRMIAYSDNFSQDLLVKRLNAMGDVDAVRNMYRDLGVLPAETAQTISVKGYASLFRTLSNARYLTPDSSEAALTILTKSDFNDGLVAGLPPGMEVAHKFGVHNVEGDRLMHDCGIIYHPVRPYLLCVMTRGDSVDVSVKFIAELSRRVYEEVQKNIRASL